jgi:hypothetical protein
MQTLISLLIGFAGGCIATGIIVVFISILKMPNQDK